MPGAILPVLLALAALLAGWVYLYQESLIFRPVALPPRYRFAFEGADIQERFVEVDGARLSALHLALPDPKGIVFYLHGNAGNLAEWFANADFYRKTGFDLFMIDYRGYGKSTGRIRSEAQLHEDVAAAWRSIAPRYLGRRKVFFGRSLGSALAARLAVSVPAGERPDLTVLASPYWSMLELAQRHYPLVPRRLLRYRLETFRDVGRIEGPVLLLHGDYDALIPYSHSERLQQVAPEARLVCIHGAAHGDVQGFPEYVDAVARGLAQL